MGVGGVDYIWGLDQFIGLTLFYYFGNELMFNIKFMNLCGEMVLIRILECYDFFI